MWGDADTAIGGNRDRFPSTQLSLIEAAAGEPLAMERVVALYWKPVYKFIRFKFHQDNETAKDLTQGFFASALERDFFQRFDPSKAGFRTYLRLAVERYAANRHEAENRQKRGGGVEFAELDAQSASTESPEEIYLREGRRQSFALAIEDLRADCARAGKHTEWAVFNHQGDAGGPAQRMVCPQGEFHRVGSCGRLRARPGVCLCGGGNALRDRAPLPGNHGAGFCGGRDHRVFDTENGDARPGET